jgi:hypothetical protein
MNGQSTLRQNHPLLDKKYRLHVGKQQWQEHRLQV